MATAWTYGVPAPRLPSFPKIGQGFGGSPTPVAANEQRYGMPGMAGAPPPRVQLGDFNFNFTAGLGGVTPTGGAATPGAFRGATPTHARGAATPTGTPTGYGAQQAGVVRRPSAPQDWAPQPDVLQRGASAPQPRDTPPQPQALARGTSAPQDWSVPTDQPQGKPGCRATSTSGMMTPATRTPASTPAPSPPATPTPTPPASPRQRMLQRGASNVTNVTDSTNGTASSGTPRSGKTTPSRRSIVSRKGSGDIVEMMQNKDKVRSVAQRPFKERGLAALDFATFGESLRNTLMDLGVNLPSDKQISALYEKHSHAGQGVAVDDFEALLFRLLCFMRAHDDVDVTPRRGGESTPAQQRDRRWRQEFISKNRRQFSEVYEVQKKLGQGNFGVVYKVAFKQQDSLSTPAKSKDKAKRSKSKGPQPKDQAEQASKHTRVSKVISKEMAQKSGLPLEKVREELHVLKNLDHPHVLRIFEDFEDDSNFFLIMETALGGDLQDYMRHMEPTDAATYEKWTAMVMYQSLSAISYCHQRGVVHKDLKPENVMLSTPKGTPLHAIHVVLVDFGLSECFSSPEGRSKVVSGTPPYMAPEVWTGNSGKACDLWSCGVMLFFMLSGRFPFHCQTPEEFAKATATLEPDWGFMGGASKEAHSLCKRLLIKSDTHRITARQAMQQAWFQKHDIHKSEKARCSQTPLNKAEMDSLVMLPQRAEFEKFLSRFVATQLDAGPQTRINNLFHALDYNGDGVIPIAFLANGLTELGIPSDLAEQVAKELDVAKRGRVSYTEFLAGFLDFQTRNPGELDDILRLAWHQFAPNENGQVKANDVQNALAARGMTVADLPNEFLLALRKDASGYLTFSWFKRLLVPNCEDLTPPARESTDRKSLKKRPNFFDRFFTGGSK